MPMAVDMVSAGTCTVMGQPWPVSAILALASRSAHGDAPCLMACYSWYEVGATVRRTSTVSMDVSRRTGRLTRLRSFTLNW